MVIYPTRNRTIESCFIGIAQANATNQGQDIDDLLGLYGPDRRFIDNISHIDIATSTITTCGNEFGSVCYQITAGIPKIWAKLLPRSGTVIVGDPPLDHS